MRISLSQAQPVSLRWDELKTGKIAVVTLNRPKQANSFNEDTIECLLGYLQEIRHHPDCRALVIRGEGKHFSAGADLNWMKRSADLTYEENYAGARTMADMFEALHSLPIPTIAVVKGAAFGGAVGLIACCDFAIGVENAKLCLSEVKIGLLPAVILPYLRNKMLPGTLKRLGLTARVFGGAEAKEYGLIDLVCTQAELEDKVREELNLLLKGGPLAQTSLKALFETLSDPDIGNNPSHATATAIATARQGAEAQSGISDFFAKKKAAWVDELPESWKLTVA